MQSLEHLGPRDVVEAMNRYQALLRAHEDEINLLNVFPVPDADTGTNLRLTVEATVASLDQQIDMEAVCSALKHGSLMGARGISGVILAQIVQAAAAIFRELEAVDAPGMAAALIAASRAADQVVTHPVEGTILTVLRDAAEAAGTAARDGGDLERVLAASGVAARESLARTPTLLPLLRRAGVVDAGGAGLCLLFEAFLEVVTGVAAGQRAVTAGPVARPGRSPEPRGPRFELGFLLETREGTADALRRTLSHLGESVVVVPGDGAWTCHVHTDDVGGAIEAALEHGRPRAIRVTDLFAQTGTHETPDRARGASTLATPASIVAVATGDGIRRAFRSLGVRTIVDGGPTMNPSVEEILEAVQLAPSDEILLVTNGGKAAAASGSLARMTSRRIHVIATTDMVQGLAAIHAFDPDRPAEDNETRMREAASRVRTGRLTRAARDTTSGAGPIRRGDWIGVADDDVVAVDRSAAAAAVALLEVLATDGPSRATVLEGEGSDQETTEAILGWLLARLPDDAIDLAHGGQPLSAYLFGLG